jgi:hypothetical protein
MRRAPVAIDNSFLNSIPLGLTGTSAPAWVYGES